jgi:ribulose-5-phosphate 4-epimerase/fuculose-1-phosphate aldolase
LASSLPLHRRADLEQSAPGGERRAGRRLVAQLGQHRCAQMRGHGSVVVGASAEEAFFACTFLEENAQIQLQAEILGGAIPLSEDQARDCAEGTFNPRLFPLLWAYYERKVKLD